MVRLRLLVVCLVGLSLGRSALVADAATASTKSAAVVKSSETDEHDEEEERVSYEGAQLLRVDAESKSIKEDILKLEDQGVLDTWSGMADDSPTVDVFVSSDNRMKLKTYLRENNVTYKIAIDNIQQAIDAENPNETSANMTIQSRADHPMTWNAYHSLDDIYAYLEYLDQTYSYCNLLNIGTTAEGRPIKGMKIYLDMGSGGGTNLEPAVFIDGGMHGREWISVASVMYIIKEIAENPDSYTDIDGFGHAWFYIFPVLNPDGYEYSRTKDRLWRKNRRKGTKTGRKYKGCDGVDLNRNFGHKWGGAGSSSNECKETYRGTAAFSEPEVKAYSEFVISEESENGEYYNAAYLSFHSYGQSITFPWSYDRINHDNYQSFQGMANEMAYRAKQVAQKTYRVGAFGSTFYPASGTSADWFVSVPKFLFSYTAELRDKGRYGFLAPAHEIVPTGSEAMQMIISLFL